MERPSHWPADARTITSRTIGARTIWARTIDTLRLRAVQLILACVCALAVAGCTIGLVPAYDAEIAEGLNSANKDALLLFATLEQGSTRDEFATHAPTYASLIGRFEELRARAATRPMPPLAERLRKIKLFTDFCDARDNPSACLNASPASMTRVLKDLRFLRDSHRESGVTRIAIEGIQRDYLTAVQQALTVEAALKR